MNVHKYKVSIKYSDEYETIETFEVSNYDIDNKSGFLILYKTNGDFLNDDKIEYINRYIRLDTIKEFSTTFYKNNKLCTSTYPNDIKENDTINKIISGKGLQPINDIPSKGIRTD